MKLIIFRLAKSDKIQTYSWIVYRSHLFLLVARIRLRWCFCRTISNTPQDIILQTFSNMCAHVRFAMMKSEPGEKKKYTKSSPLSILVSVTIIRLGHECTHRPYLSYRLKQKLRIFVIPHYMYDKPTKGHMDQFHWNSRKPPIFRS